MSTPHEIVAARLMGAIGALFAAAGGPDVTRDADLPEIVGAQGLVNLTFGDPTEEGRPLGAVAREWSRVCTIEMAVQAAATETRIARLEGLITVLADLAPAGVAPEVDWLDVGAPIQSETVPMDGASSIRAAVVEVTAFYRTGSNPMEPAA